MKEKRNYGIDLLRVLSMLYVVILHMLKPGLVQIGHFLKMFFPVSTDIYWYFTAYTALFLLIPLLNSAVRYCSKANLRVLFVALILIFSVFGSFTDKWYLARGYSFAWLVILYLLGAAIKKVRHWKPRDGMCRGRRDSAVLYGILAVADWRCCL